MSGPRNEKANIELCYIDVGGTFTDAFLVNAEGDYSSAKAPSTPDDVSGGFVNAVSNAADAMAPGTGVLNVRAGAYARSERVTLTSRTGMAANPAV